MIPFEGMKSKQLTDSIFKEISEKAEKATIELARIYGEPELLKGYGRRNTTLMAIAPTNLVVLFTVRCLWELNQSNLITL